MKKRSVRGRKSAHIKLRQDTYNSLSAFLLFILSLLIWASFLYKGTILTYINNFIRDYIGLSAGYFLPLPLLSSSAFIWGFKTRFSRPNALFGSFLILFCLIGFFNSGKFGSLMWSNVSALISPIGSSLIFFAGIFSGLLILFDIPFEKVLTVIGRILGIFAKIAPKEKLGVFDKNAIKPTVQTVKPDFAIKPNFVLPKQAVNTGEKINPSVKPQPIPSAINTPWNYPPLSILSENISGKADRGNVNDNANIIESTLDAFGISAKVKDVNYGPAVTQYALEVALGTKLSKISALGSDLALALAAPTGQIRIEAPIPGKSLVGIELPNRTPEFVSLKKVLEEDVLLHHKSKLAVALGLDVSGKPIVGDISKMPHVLIAGSTGSGKSVAINAFIGSLLFRCSPQDLNLILIDPKRVELTGYNGIPHLLTPVIVEPEKVLSALKWSTNEMDRRYKLFAEVGVRNLEGYNELSGFQALPYIVIFVDELADIMLYAPVEVEDSITRIAQMARATGIHLVIATQRPSVDIITGLIKANIPTRIAFAVSSMIDSRVIIDQPGAEKLLGKGDMLYVPPDQAKPTRIQGCLITEKETRQLIDFLKKQGIAPHYTEEVLTQQVSIKGRGKGSAFISSNGEDRDSLFIDAFRLIAQHNQASASFLQRKLSIGYARAARILDELHNAGIIGPGEGAKPRDILVTDVENYISSQS